MKHSTFNISFFNGLGINHLWWKNVMEPPAHTIRLQGQGTGSSVLIWNRLLQNRGLTVPLHYLMSNLLLVLCTTDHCIHICPGRQKWRAQITKPKRPHSQALQTPTTHDLDLSKDQRSIFYYLHSHRFEFIRTIAPRSPHIHWPHTIQSVPAKNGPLLVCGGKFNDY